MGREYEKTRHNAGFIFLDQIHDHLTFTENLKLKSVFSELKTQNSKLLLAKPTTLMNKSGEAVTLLKNFYKFSNEEILVCFDDLDIGLGEYKVQFEKGPRIHNGLNSVEQFVGEDFWRLRIGIDSRTEEIRKYMSGSDFVLSKFSNDEIVKITDTFAKIRTDLKISHGDLT